jgi:putative flippase GtrA
MSEVNPTVENNEAPSAAPVPKVAAAGVAGAIVLVVVFFVQTFVPGFEIPEAVASAVTIIVAFAAGYIKRPR